jgi:transcriptional regulator with XRE-family HTH domain
MKIAQKKYTQSVKLSTLRILQKNDFNYLKTEKSTGVSRSTIKKWEIDLGTEVFSGKSPAEEALAEIDAEMKYNDTIIIRTLFAIRKRALQKVLLMTEKEAKVESLINVLKYASGELQKFSETENARPNSRDNIIQIINGEMRLSEERLRNT